MKKRGESVEHEMPDLENDGSTAIRREGVESQAALQQHAGPAGRIHKGAVVDELVEAFKKYQ